MSALPDPVAVATAAGGDAAGAYATAGTALTATVGGVSLGVVASTVTAAVGLFVAYQAYRGFRRNQSRPMLYLAVGILLVTTVSFVASYIVAVTLGASDAVAILVRVLFDVAGLAAILYALTGA